MSIVLGGRKVDTPGVTTISWLDDPRVPRTPHTNPRAYRIRAVVLHTTSGRPSGLAPGGKTPRDPFAWARDAADNARVVSWDATVNTDGTVTWQNDPLTGITWHATQVNPYTLGIEIAQGPNGEVYQAQMDATVRLLDVLTAELGIQRQIPWYQGAPDRRVLTRLRPEGGAGADVVGVYGHRNVTSEKSDPGDQIFNALAAAGYEKFDLEAQQDKQEWAARQASLGITPDGVPLGQTVQALVNAGKAAGIWVSRGASVLLPLVALTLGAGALWWYASRH